MKWESKNDMKEFLKSTKGRVCIIVVLALILAGLLGVVYSLWLYEQPKFHDMTIELGEDLPETAEFLTKYANEEKARLVTSKANIDLEHVGQVSLVFCHGKKEETVTLTIVDTTAPDLQLRDLCLTTEQSVAPELFVEQIHDFDQVELSFGEDTVFPDTYEDVKVSIVARDASGNTATESCLLTWQWLRESLDIELGTVLEKADLLLNPELDEALLDQVALDKVNEAPVGRYVIASSSGSKHVTCTITVTDTTGPELVLKEVYVYLNGSAKLEDFIESVTDLSGVAETRLMTELRFDEESEQTVTVEAEDVYGNVTTLETTLHIVTDATAPTFSGLSNMTVEKHSTPDFKSGVTATDDKDGKVSFTWDTSKLDLTKAGTYYVTYTAKDKSGNVATAKRKVTVNHDQEDTDALVASIAAKAGDDPVSIKNYVKNYVRSYVSNADGGKDPVWYGFTNRRGNCIVFAHCLKAVLDAKGYETKLIWVTKPTSKIKSHYWVLIKIDGEWMHLDATPGRTTHQKYDLMNDAQRYETLKTGGVQRDWDRTLAAYG